MPSPGNKQRMVQRTEEIEDRMYKSSLKQIVAFLNATLPSVEECEDPETIGKSQVEIKKVKSKQDKDSGPQSSYLVRDVTPTRVPAKLEKPETVKKRTNKFSERKYNDIKINRKLRQEKKKPVSKSMKDPSA